MTFDGFGAAIMRRLRETNWLAALAAVVLQGLFLLLLSTIGIISVTRNVDAPTLKVFTPSEAPAASPPPAAKEQHEKPVQKEVPKTDAVIPPAMVPIPMTQTVQAAQETPTPPAPPAASSAPAAITLSSAGTGPVSVASLGTNLLNGPAPTYPIASRRKREQGVVVLRLVISEVGRVTQVSVETSSGFPALDEAAVSAVRKWRWSPTARAGRPIVVTGLVRIPFVLKAT